jgi:hypothetical protein
MITLASMNFYERYNGYDGNESWAANKGKESISLHACP